MNRLRVMLLLAGAMVEGAHGASTVAITNFSASPAGFTFEWNGLGSNTAYTVQYRDRRSLAEGPWFPAPAAQRWPIPLPEWTEGTLGGLQERYYRVVAVPAAERGKVLSSGLSNTLNTTYLRTVFSAAHIPVTPQYSVRVYKVVYETIDPLGGRTRASGALLLPVGVNRPLPLVTYQHGTITQTNKAPSGLDITTEVTVGIAFATTGYAAAVPDYLGLGVSPGLHPYHHALSEATACVDMLRAAKTVCSANGYALTNRLFLCGYSQGGHATMALFRELEMFHTNEFSVTACAPMAGAYDLSGVTTADLLSGRQQPNPYYFAYLLAAYQEVYHFAASLADLLAPPYDSTLPPLFSGNAGSSQINAAMPTNSPLHILKPELLAAFQSNPDHPLRLALQDNDLYNWRPRAPLRLYHCLADGDVVFLNSQAAYDSFRALGVTDVQLIDPLPSATHGDCVIPSLTLAKAWFDSLR
jgi:hypothetical protein